MNETLLWIQDKYNSGDDEIIADGKVVSSSKERTEYFHKLLGFSQLASFDGENIKETWTMSGYSKNFKYLYTRRPAGIFIQSCFNETDNKNRKIVFMFYMPNTQTMKDAINELEDMASKKGYSFSEKEVEYLLHRAKERNRFATTMVEHYMEFEESQQVSSVNIRAAGSNNNIILYEKPLLWKHLLIALIIILCIIIIFWVFIK